MRELLTSPVPAYTASLPREELSAVSARRMVATVLDMWHLDVLADGAAVVVAELVANAVQHSDGPAIRVTISHTGHAAVRVAVVDFASDPPRHRAPTPVDEGGRGLMLIEALCERWGWDPLPWGKRVWADVCAGQGAS